MTMSPYEESHFLRECVVDINAAVVGVSKTEWKCVQDGDATKEKAAAIMRKQHFDVLPIGNGTEIKKYFRTHKWNDYSSIFQETVTRRDVIPFNTHVREVIKGFALESRNFYFLQNERRIIVGLISVVNLNCRQVKVYLFNLLSELEVHLGTFITEHVAEDKLLNMTLGDKQDEQGKEKHSSVKKRYQE